MNRAHPYSPLTLTASIAFLLLIPLLAGATILYVGPNETYDNIKWALSQASDGDTIIVRDGVYVQDIKVYKSVVLMSENRHGAVIGDSTDAVARISISRAGVEGVIIDGFKIIDGNMAGIVVGDGNPEHAPINCIIRNNYIQNRNRGIKVDRTSVNLVISGNTITGCVESAIIHMGDGENIIADNILEKCGDKGIWIQEQDAGSYIIKDNIIQENQSAGIEIDRSNVLIEGNTISKNTGNGIEIHRSNIRIKRNKIERNHIGINTSSGQREIVVSDTNQIVKNTSHGILIENRTHATINKSIISQNGEEGIRNHGISTISGNNIDYNKGTGIWVLSGASTITDNVIHFNEIHGIEVSNECENVAINDNAITNNGVVGVMTGDGLIMKGNFIDGNGDNGILLTPSADSVEITDQNIISNSGMDEIVVDSEFPSLIRNNTIESDTTLSGGNSEFNGIVINGSAVVDGNTIRNINGSGIYVQESGEVVITGKNQITANHTGVTIAGSADVKNNIISGNYERGIRVEPSASQVTLSWNRIEDNKTGVAVLPDSKDIALYNNTISSNNGGLFSAGEPKLRSNTIQGNVEYGIKIRYEGIDLGNSMDADSGKNAILDNEVWNIINGTPGEIDAFCNYWGTNNIDSIDITIQDDNEDSLLGPVIFEPFLKEYNVGTDKFSIFSSAFGITDPLQVYPNPAKGDMVAHFQLPAPAEVYLYILSASGKIERSLLGGEFYDAGSFKIVWDGRANDGRIVPNGVYFAVLRCNGYTFTRKIVVVR